MAFFDWLRGSSPLQAALKRGLSDGGNLLRELNDLEDYQVKSRVDALAICAALQRVVEDKVPRGKSHTSPLHALTELFQSVEGAECAAFGVLQERGTSLLVQILREGLNKKGNHSKDDLLFVLKVLAMYGTSDGADAVIEAIRRRFEPDGFMWTIILSVFNQDHPEAVRLFTELSQPLHAGFVSIALLDAANRFLLDGGEARHPFDSDEGLARLEEWLTDADPEKASYAVSATAAIPFLNHEGRQRLLVLALAHRDASVVMEAAWAAAKTGDERGIEALVRCCLSVNQSTQARQYLKELDRSDAVPPAALVPDFQARAEFAQWLAHPNELGRPPDEVEIVDHRQLCWPPEFDPKPFWLLRYRAKAQTELDEDDIGVGLAGSVTWCFFSRELSQRPPEDGYAIHCCWEMESAKLLKLAEVDEDSNEYDSFLNQWAGRPLVSAKVKHVAELSPELKRPQRLVAVAEAQLEDADGWVVLDGAESRWYPAKEMPFGEYAKTVLSIHVGHKLLRLPESGPRNSWLKTPTPRSPERIVVVYERLLSDFNSLVEKRDSKLAATYQQINKHFDSYIDALPVIRGGNREQHLAAAYEQVFKLAAKAESSLEKKSYDSFSAIGRNFESYTNALAASGRQHDIKALVTFFAPRWEHNLGYGRLGQAAFKADDFQLAEIFFLKLKEGLEDWPRCEEMGLLADIWCQRGKRDEARSLLIECMKGVLAESLEATGSDRQRHEDWFQNHRRMFLRLFPGDLTQLDVQGVPGTTLKQTK
jgi:hypothetical protein